MIHICMRMEKIAKFKAVQKICITKKMYQFQKLSVLTIVKRYRADRAFLHDEIQIFSMYFLKNYLTPNNLIYFNKNN